MLARWVPSSWTGNTAPEVESDFALIKLERANHPNGLGAGAWMALSSIDDAATYATKQAVMNGFPVDGPDGANFVAQFVSVTDPTIANPPWQTADWEFYSPAHLYHRSGAVDSSTTQQQLAYLADSSGGDSGAGVFYYTDGSSEYTGQSHYIIGVHHGSAVQDVTHVRGAQASAHTALAAPDWTVDAAHLAVPPPSRGGAALRPSAHVLVPNAERLGMAPTWAAKTRAGGDQPRRWRRSSRALRGSVATGVAPPRRSSAEGVPFQRLKAVRRTYVGCL